MADQDRQRQIDEIFLQAVELKPADIGAFLDRACQDDASMRLAVEQLLGADFQLQADDHQLAATPPRDGILKELRGAAEAAMGSGQKLRSGAADRNLLYGIIALQMNFISRDGLIRAMQTWVLDKARPIERILVDQGDLAEPTRALLTALVDRHVDHFGGDPARSLAALSSDSHLKRKLDELQDSELQQSVVFLGRSSPVDGDEPTVAVGAGSQRGGRFRVLRPYREGGLGRVSVALDQELNREVALKEVLERYSGYQMVYDRLRIEAEITGCLEHPGIVPVYGLGNTAAGSPFYCMRFIRGDSLKDAIRSFHRTRSSLSTADRNLELRGLLRRFIDVCDAVGYAHSRRVLHRDLKPGNIMLGKYGETLVVDWGLAKATATGGEPDKADMTEVPIVPRSGSTAAPTLDGSAIGTPEYMSPEQAEGRIDELGPATDVFSLGATLFCVMTGRAPIDGQGVAEKLQKVRDGEFPRPTELDATLPRPLEAICLRAMERRPTDRYDSPTELSQDLERWLADEPVTAFAEPWTWRAARMLRKNRTAALTTTAATVMAILGLIGINLVTQAKNHEIEQKNVALKQSREEIETNYGQLTDLSKLLIFSAENDLSQTPGSANLRREFTQGALAVYDRIGNELSGANKARITHSQLHRKLANLYRGNGDLTSAIKHYEDALGILKALRRDNPELPDGRGFQSETLRDFATTIFLTGDLAAAISNNADAIRIGEGLIQEYPGKPNSQRLDAVNRIDGAKYQVELGNHQTALEYAGQAVHWLQPVIDGERKAAPGASEKARRDGEPRHQDLLMLLFARLSQSECNRELQDYDSAEDAMAAAIHRAQTGLDVTPSSDFLRADRHLLARCLLERVRLDLDQDAPGPEAETQIAQAIEIWDSLNEQFPEFRVYGRYLAQALGEYGNLLAVTGQPDSAEGRFLSALEVVNNLLVSHPDDFQTLEVGGDVRLELSRFHQQEDDHSSALELASAAIEQYEQAQRLNQQSIRLRIRLERARRWVQELSRQTE